MTTSLPSALPHAIVILTGRNLRLARRRAGISQADLAAAVGVTFQQIQKYENATNRMSLSRAYELCHHIGINVADLFDGSIAAAPSRAFRSRSFEHWVALYVRAHDAGLADKLVRFASEAIALHSPADPPAQFPIS